MKTGWAENESGQIPLPDHHPHVFKIFSRFIYCNAIFSAIDSVSDEQPVDMEWQLLADAWVIGDYLEAMDFKDAIVDAMIEKVLDTPQGRRPQHGMHQIIYPMSQRKSPIRKLITDIAAHTWSASFVKERSNQPEWSDFFKDIAMARFSINEKSTPQYITDPCYYHEHRLKGDPCYRTRIGKS